ncbi:MAG: phytanoyl-CoA dioxygenase family protein [Gammaproteobacteria bacterium]|nr:phytanoyl-CoA dioxygenase family protein [Gammaproteobacteria bacterium]
MNNCPAYEFAVEQNSLDKNQQSQRRLLDYARDGYLILDSELPLDVLTGAADYMRTMLFDEHGSANTRRGHNAWDECDAIREIACNTKLTTILNDLYGRRPIPFQTINFPIGSEQPTHADGFHFNSIPSRFVCGAWVALEDIDEDNGPLHYYPGSHTLPEYQMLDCVEASTELKDFPGFDEYKEYYEPFIQRVLNDKGFERKELHVKKGQAIIWSAGLCHGGSPIRDPSRTRLSQVTHYFFEHCTYYSPRFCNPQLGKLWLRNVRDVNSGEFVPHRFNGKSFSIPRAGPYRFDKNGRPVSLAPFSFEQLLRSWREKLRV